MYSRPEQKLQVFAKETDREHTEIDIFSTFNVAAEELDFKVLVVKELGALEAPGGNEATAAEATEEEAKKTTLENEIAR